MLVLLFVSARRARADEAVTPPRPIAEARVEYPAGGEGDHAVLLELVVTAEGGVEEARVLAGEPLFAEAALRAVSSVRFEPARRAGRALAARIRFTVLFERQDASPSDGPNAAAVRAQATEGQSRAPPRAVAAQTNLPMEVTVRGERTTGAVTFGRAEVRELPGALGDPFRAIEAAPGVTPTLSGAPYFYIRGAPPGNVGYFIDGVRLPALFHAIAGPAVVHPGLIDKVDLYAGPYPASFGRFAGGIVAGTTLPPPLRARGELGVRATDSSGLIETPLFDDRASVTLAGRYAYANPILQRFAPELSVSYWDYQARASVALSSADRLTLFAFGARDHLTDENDDRVRTVYGVEFHRTELAYRREFAEGWLRVSSLVGWGRSALRDGDVRVEDLSTRLRADISENLGARAWLLAGVELGQDRYLLDLGSLDDPDARAEYAREFPTRAESVGSAYVSVALDLGAGVRVTPGVRTDLYASDEGSAFGVDPRVTTEFALSQHVTWIHGLGIAQQPRAAALPSPGNAPKQAGGLQVAVQSSSGIRWALPSALMLDVTLFQSALFNLTDEAGQTRFDDVDDAVDEFTRSTGSARGLELSLRRKLTERVGGYLSYTLATARRSLGRAEGPARFDRRHVLSAAVTFELGRGFRAGTRGLFYTGIPAEVAYLEAAQDPPRTRPFYRIDVRGERRWDLGETGYVALVFEVLNTTLNEEVLSASCHAYRCEQPTVGPVTIPNLGLEAGF